MDQVEQGIRTRGESDCEKLLDKIFAKLDAGWFDFAIKCTTEAQEELAKEKKRLDAIIGTTQEKKEKVEQQKPSTSSENGAPKPKFEKEFKKLEDQEFKQMMITKLGNKFDESLDAWIGVNQLFTQRGKKGVVKLDEIMSQYAGAYRYACALQSPIGKTRPPVFLKLAGKDLSVCIDIKKMKPEYDLLTKGVESVEESVEGSD
jgi:hypothetical protein